MGQVFIRLRELASEPARGDRPARVGRLPVSESSIWRWVGRGEFPAPVKLAGGTTAWRIADVEAWEQSRQVSAAGGAKRRSAKVDA